MTPFVHRLLELFKQNNYTLGSFARCKPRAVKAKIGLGHRPLNSKSYRPVSFGSSTGSGKCAFSCCRSLLPSSDLKVYGCGGKTVNIEAASNQHSQKKDSNGRKRIRDTYLRYTTTTNGSEDARVCIVRLEIILQQKKKKKNGPTGLHIQTMCM